MPCQTIGMRLVSPFLLLMILTPLAAQVRVDYRGIKAWIARAQVAPQRPASWEAASAATEGGQMAEASWGSFGDLISNLPPPPSPSHVEAFVKALRRADPTHLDTELAPLFPPLPGVMAEVKVVANGFPIWGDMYVRRFKVQDGSQVEDERGRLVILLNACLVAGPAYGKTPDDQATGALNVLRHEIFHVYYGTMREQDPRHKPDSALKPIESLLLTTQDEGIAHFLADQVDLRAKGFPAGRGEKALKDLEAALVSIREGKATSELLLNANQGPFWSKYAAISGMLFAFGVEKAQGAEGLKASLREGPASLIRRYMEATAHIPELPKPGPEVLAWSKALAELR